MPNLYNPSPIHNLLMKNKFLIRRADGYLTPRRAKYFVLRLDYHHKESKNQETYAARFALCEYIRFCKGIIPKNKYAIDCAKVAQQALGRRQVP